MSDPRPPLPHDFLPEVASFTVVSDEVKPGATLDDAQVQAAGGDLDRVHRAIVPRHAACARPVATVRTT